MSASVQESFEEQTLIITTSSKLIVPDKHHDNRTVLKDLIELEVNYFYEKSQVEVKRGVDISPIFFSIKLKLNKLNLTKNLF